MCWRRGREPVAKRGVVGTVQPEEFPFRWVRDERAEGVWKPTGGDSVW